MKSEKGWDIALEEDSEHFFITYPVQKMSKALERYWDDFEDDTPDILVMNLDTEEVYRVKVLGRDKFDCEPWEGRKDEDD